MTIAKIKSVDATKYLNRLCPGLLRIINFISQLKHMLIFEYQYV